MKKKMITIKEKTAKDAHLRLLEHTEAHGKVAQRDDQVERRGERENLLHWASMKLQVYKRQAAAGQPERRLTTAIIRPAATMMAMPTKVMASGQALKTSIPSRLTHNS